MHTASEAGDRVNGDMGGMTNGVPTASVIAGKSVTVPVPQLVPVPAVIVTVPAVVMVVAMPQICTTLPADSAMTCVAVDTAETRAEELQMLPLAATPISFDVAP